MLTHFNGPLSRYVKLRVAHAPGMPERFPRHWLQRKPLVSDPGMQYGTCVTHAPWCISGLLTCGGGENVPGIPGACANRGFAHLVRDHEGHLFITGSLYGEATEKCHNDTMRFIFINSSPRMVNTGKIMSLQWRHNERDGVSNHQPHDCLLNSLFRRRS